MHPWFFFSEAFGHGGGEELDAVGVREKTVAKGRLAWGRGEHVQDEE